MSVPLITVAIPAYNAAAFLPAAIESVLAQTFSNFELIVINDCSQDNTSSVISKYKNQDKRIKFYENQRNLGIAGNRNRAVSLASGKYLMWQDADDISLPYRMESQYKFLEDNPGVGIVGGGLEIFRGEKVTGFRFYPLQDADIRRCIFRYSPIAQPAAMIRLSALHAAGEYDLTYPPAEDLDMTFRIGLRYELANLDSVVIRYRESQTSATATKLKEMELNTIAIRRKYSRSECYKMSTFDKFYNFIHFFSVWTLPPRFKLYLFHLWRNKKS